MALFLIVLRCFFIASIANSRQYVKPLSERLLYEALGINLENFESRSNKENNYQFLLPYHTSQIKSVPKDVAYTENSETNKNRIARYLEDNNIICEVSVTKGVFNEEGYEFYPNEYINRTCTYTKADPFKIESNGQKKAEMCLHDDNDFGCQTLYEELSVLKKSLKNKHECWEHMTQLVAVGCKCNIRFTY